MKYMLLLLASVLPQNAHGYTPATLDTGLVATGASYIPVGQIVLNVISVLSATATNLCIGLFCYGALLYVISLEKDERKSEGKSYMVGSVIGYAVIRGAVGIVDFAFYFLSLL